MTNKRSKKAPRSMRYYFVDEGGDSTLFARKGKVLIGTEGCSHFFILGVLDVLDPASLQDNMDNLRVELVNDPYFKNIPSMSPKAKKTAISFHAKDDIPEVRKEVFSLFCRSSG